MSDFLVLASDDALLASESLSVRFPVMQPAVAVLPSSAMAEPSDRLVLQLIEEMTSAWRHGQRPRAEEYLSRCPALCESSDAALRVIEHEVRLLRKGGIEVSGTELAARFPEWRERVRALADPTSVVSRATPSRNLAGPDGMVGDYRLRAILGRGARGVVYLAEQLSLAGRPVVLKITPRDGSEHLSLARLQHANIVPLYAVQDLADRDARLLCMPYLGGTTLARVLSAVRDVPAGQRTGRDLLNAVDEAQADSPIPAPLQGPARQLLARLSYTKAVCWLGACLADALHFAHQRDVLHLDIKPSNVLLAADGTPMLLDFHLAQAPLRAGEQVPHRLGGTAAYMPAEQWAAMVQARDGKPVSTVVDGRADIYALGVLLYEALGGIIPARFSPTSFRRFERPPRVPRGLADIVAKCLAFEPAARYASAALLAEDLRRQFADLPLRGVANRSLVERWRKWRRRRPHALGRALVITCVVLGMLVSLIAANGDARQRIQAAERLLAESRGLLDGREYRAATRSLERGLSLVAPEHGLSLVAHTPRARRLRASLSSTLQAARRAVMAEDLHAKLDQLRILHGSDLPPSAELRALERQLQSTWEARGAIVKYLNEGAAGDRAPQLRADALDLAALWSDLSVRLASPDNRAARRRDALQTLAQAEDLFGPSPVLERERQRYAEALGLVELARAAEHRSRLLPPRSAWEHYALGRSLLDAGDLNAAAAEFERATDLEPKDLWGHFYQGICDYRRGRFEAAFHAFDICVALADKTAECYYNRARAESALSATEHALRDYGRALQLAPRMASAALNRGVIHYGASRYKEAIDDFQRALEAGGEPIVAHYNLALAYHAQGDRAKARANVEDVLRIAPRHEEARRLEQQLDRER